LASSSSPSRWTWTTRPTRFATDGGIRAVEDKIMFGKIGLIKIVLARYFDEIMLTRYFDFDVNLNVKFINRSLQYGNADMS
jgi:hypothetical protein